MDWASTYQAVPTLIDLQLEAHGGQRVRPRGEGDARADFDGQFSEWYADLWTTLADTLKLSDEAHTSTSTEPRLQSQHGQPADHQPGRRLVPGAAQHLDGQPGVARRATGAQPGTSSSGCPPGWSTPTGDHLGVLPRNNVDLIRRVLARFDLDAGTYVTITPTGGGSYTHLPLGEPSPLLGILGSCVELQDMASRTDLAVLARYAGDPDEQAELEAMSGLDEEGKGGVPRAGSGAAAHGAGSAR